MVVYLQANVRKWQTNKLIIEETRKDFENIFTKIVKNNDYKVICKFTLITVSIIFHHAVNFMVY